MLLLWTFLGLAAVFTVALHRVLRLSFRLELLLVASALASGAVSVPAVILHGFAAGARFLACSLLCVLGAQWTLQRRRNPKQLVLGFFHPHADQRAGFALLFSCVADGMRLWQWRARAVEHDCDATEGQGARAQRRAILHLHGFSVERQSVRHPAKSACFATLRSAVSLLIDDVARCCCCCYCRRKTCSGST